MNSTSISVISVTISGLFFSHSPTAQVGVDSFGLGILVGVFGTISTIAAVLQGNPVGSAGTAVFFARWWWNTSSILEDFGTSKWVWVNTYRIL